MERFLEIIAFLTVNLFRRVLVFLACHSSFAPRLVSERARETKHALFYYLGGLLDHVEAHGARGALDGAHRSSNARRGQVFGLGSRDLFYLLSSDLADFALVWSWGTLFDSRRLEQQDGSGWALGNEGK